jgi:hypothetical protein
MRARSGAAAQAALAWENEEEERSSSAKVRSASFRDYALAAIGAVSVLGSVSVLSSVLGLQPPQNTTGNTSTHNGGGAEQRPVDPEAPALAVRDLPSNWSAAELQSVEDAVAEIWVRVGIPLN